MTDDLTLAQLLRVIVVISGLLLSCWALLDDLTDLANVKLYGEVGGPRWVTATEHAQFNAMLLVGWLCATGVLAIAISLPPRADTGQDALATLASWLTFVFGVCVLAAQAVRRAARVRIRALPLVAWERMLQSMFDGMSTEERASLSLRLLAATSAGREMGHLIANDLAAPVGLIDLVLADAVLTEGQRTDLIEAREHILGVSDRAAGLHAEIKAQEAQRP